MYRFEEYVEAAQSADSVDDLAGLFSRTIRNDGYENCILTSVRANDVGHVCWFEFPDGYAERYIDERWAQIDPVLARTMSAPRPFFWNDVYEATPLTADQVSFLNECREMGVHSGIVFPMHGPGNRLEVMSISRRTSDPPNADRLRMLHAISVQTWSRSLELVTDDPFPQFEQVQLTAREIEILNWCKHGKSYGDIGDILSISRKTVEFHITNVMNKLGACNRISAVVIAIQRGLISL